MLDPSTAPRTFSSDRLSTSVSSMTVPVSGNAALVIAVVMELASVNDTATRTLLPSSSGVSRVRADVCPGYVGGVRGPVLIHPGPLVAVDDVTQPVRVRDGAGVGSQRHSHAGNPLYDRLALRRPVLAPVDAHSGWPIRRKQGPP